MNRKYKIAEPAEPDDGDVPMTRFRKNLLIDELDDVARAQTQTMPFGQYKGQPITDVPASYLHWVLKNVDKETILKINICSHLGIEPQPEWFDDRPKPTKSKVISLVEETMRESLESLPEDRKGFKQLYDFYNRLLNKLDTLKG